VLAKLPELEVNRRTADQIQRRLRFLGLMVRARVRGAKVRDRVRRGEEEWWLLWL